MAAEKNRNPSPYILGIDIGTTTVKVCLLNAHNGTVAESLSRETKADVPSELGPLGSEQDVHKICTALQFCVSRLPKESLARVTRIGLSGQMHGCVLWKARESWHQNNFGRYEVDNVSCLYTWQDGRCTSEFLAGLPKPDSHLPVSTGCGCATIFWLQRNQPDLISRYDRAGCIQDFVVAMLCGLDKPITSSQNAASWGYFDTTTLSWNVNRLAEGGFPIHFLPEVVEAGKEAGKTINSWYGISEGTPVLAALGDFQCSVLSTMENEHDAVLNISTSAQLAFLMPADFSPPTSVSLTPLVHFPYFEGRYLAVAASLNGGNVLASFVKLLQQWTHELGLGVPESKIWERLATTALESTVESEMIVIPTLYGERHLPNQRASVLNIDPTNLTLGKVARSVFRGIVTNLHSMLPLDQLVEAGVQRIVGSGTALTKNAVLRQEVQRHYHSIPIVFGDGSDAAVGVAKAVFKYS